MSSKKKIASLIALVMMTSTFSAGYAEGNCDIVIDSIEEVTVSAENVLYTDEDYLCAELNLKNDSALKEDIKVKINIKDAKGNILARSILTRKLNANQNVPVKFSAADVCGGKNVTLFVDVLRNGIYDRIYVSPNGDDKNDGTKTSPLKTVSAAVNMLYSRNKDEKYQGRDITVEFAQGNYSVSNPIVINDAKISNFSSVTLEGKGENTVLYGGLAVKGSDFTKVEDTLTLSKFGVSGGLYKLELDKYGIKTDYSKPDTMKNDPIFDTIYYNNNACQIARYPNAADGFITSDISVDELRTLSISSPDISSKWVDYDEAWIRGWFAWDWDLNSAHVGSITTGNLRTDKLFCGTIKNDELPVTKTDKRWYIYNMPQVLDTEGEYVINGNILYFCPPAADVKNGTFDNNDIFLNISDNSILEIKDVSNVAVEKITFKNSKNNLVNVESDNVKIAGCTFTNAMNGLNIKGNNNLVTSCDFMDLEGFGATVSGGDEITLTSSNSIIQNCLFKRTGRINRTNCPALLLGGCGVTAEKNTLTETPHSALSYSGNNHVIEYNDLYDCLKDAADDAGIIYTGNNLSNMGTVIKHNYLHDSNSGLGAVYWDDWLSGQTALENVIENVDNTLLIHGGVCNTFSGNIIKNVTRGLAVRGKGRNVTENGVTFNVWDSQAIGYSENDGGYNPYYNVFLSNLVGNFYAPETYTAKPWRGDVWQAAFGRVLKYVDHKDTDMANETTFQNNSFVNVTTAIYPYAATAMSDLILKDNEEGLTSVPVSKLDLYNDVVSNSGVYKDNYRTK